MQKDLVDPFVKIAEDAGFVFWNDEEWKPDDELIDWSASYDKELQLFGELIVRRCIEICEKGVVTQTTSSGVSLLIKQHFGLN